METGSRTEMVRNVGFRFGNLRGAAVCQSMNSVESWSAQNSRSSSSDRNSGAAFFFVIGIGVPFTSIHVADGDYPQQRTANSEHNEQASSAAGLPECVVPFLLLRMTDIGANG